MSALVHTEARLQELNDGRAPAGMDIVIVDEDGEPVGSLLSHAVPVAGDTVSVYSAGMGEYKPHTVLRRDFDPHGFVVVVERTTPLKPWIR